MQTEGFHGKFKGSFHTAFKTITEESIFALYKGASLPFVGWGVIDSFLWLGLLESRRLITKIRGYNDINEFHLYEHFLCGCIAGWVSTIAATPVEQIKAKLQVQYSDKSSQIYKGPIDCLKQLYSNNGIKGFYKGMTGSLFFRSFISIYFTSYVLWKQYFVSLNESGFVPEFLVSFVSGGMAANTFWVIALPADCIKNRMMAQRDIVPPLYPNVLSCIKHIYRIEGINGFYRGVVPCALRSFPTNGAAFVCAEFVQKYLPK